MGLDIGSEGTWKRLFKRLRDRGLRGVDLITSDSHRGLVKALRRQFQGAAWQRCQTHLMRNVLGQTPRHLKVEMTAWLRRIFRSESKAEARQAFGELARELDGKAEKALQTLETGLCRAGSAGKVSEAPSDHKHGRAAHRGDPPPRAGHPDLSEYLSERCFKSNTSSGSPDENTST